MGSSVSAKFPISATGNTANLPTSLGETEAIVFSISQFHFSLLFFLCLTFPPSIHHIKLIQNKQEHNDINDNVIYTLKAYVYLGVLVHALQLTGGATFIDCSKSQ